MNSSTYPRPVGIEDMEDVVSTNRDIEASASARAAAIAALPRTDAVPEVDERMLTAPSAYGRDIEAGPGQQIAREMARQWLVRADIKAAARPGTTTAEQAEINQLKAEISGCATKTRPSKRRLDMRVI
jgi:hypothetical protein